MKLKTKYVCNNCGGDSPKWQGQCPHCNQWNTLEEEVVSNVKVSPSKNRFSITNVSGKIKKLKDVSELDAERFSSGLPELDRVLGGGFVYGSVVLVGGEPGAGKLTLLLQTLANQTENVLYISGEESEQQIKSRFKRLGLNDEYISIYSEIELEKILSALESERPKLAIIDSIQTMFSGLLTSTPGSVSQVKECASQLTRFAKQNNITLVLVGQVTKEGDVAGPRVLEHIVDAVLFFEGDKDGQFRIIRALKNRFGSVNEISVFSMTGKGLVEVLNPTGVFVTSSEGKAGSCIFVAQEGNRPFLLEIQSLIDETPLPNPIRRGLGFDQNRLSMLCAVIHKYFNMPIYNQNVFVSVIGGIKISDSAIDLPVLLSMISSFRNKPLPSKLAAIGEVGLTGDLHTPNNLEQRINEAKKLGFELFIIPDSPHVKINIKGVKLVKCKNVNSAVEQIMNM